MVGIVHSVRLDALFAITLVDDQQGRQAADHAYFVNPLSIRLEVVRFG